MERGCRSVVDSLLQYLTSGFECFEEDGLYWLVTPYSLPDGDLLELGVRDDGDTVTVSDFGETARFLAVNGYDPTKTERGALVLSHIISRTAIEPLLPEVRKTVPREQLSEAVFDVITACLALADTIYLSRAYQPTDFLDEVAHFLAELNVKWVRGREVYGLAGRKYVVHFTILPEEPYRGREALLHTLSAKKPGAAKRAVDTVVRMWFDIENHRWKGTVVDDRLFDWPEHDIILLKRLSAVYRWSERSKLGQDIVAAVKQ